MANWGVIVCSFQQVSDLVAWDVEELDITEAQRMEAMVPHCRPEVVLNCAAYTKVDACGQERKLADHVNIARPHILAVILTRQGGLLIHISTDHVFDCAKPLPEPYRSAGIDLMRPWRDELDEFVTRCRDELVQEARQEFAQI